MWSCHLWTVQEFSGSKEAVGCHTKGTPGVSCGPLPSAAIADSATISILFPHLTSRGICRRVTHRAEETDGALRLWRLAQQYAARQNCVRHPRPANSTQTASRNRPHTKKGFRSGSSDRVSRHTGPRVATLSQGRCPRRWPTVSTMQRPGTAECSHREHTRDTDSS